MEIYDKISFIPNHFINVTKKHSLPGFSLTDTNSLRSNLL